MQSSGRASLRSLLVMVLVVCLVEGTAEQRINSRGSKASNLIQKINGWRSQRGGSCLSYGHSCWGAHGKRSGKPPAAAPDWYLTRILRRLDASDGPSGAKQTDEQIENDTYRRADAPPARQSEEVPAEGARTPEAKPMLDDDVISKIRLWQMMRAAAEQQ